MLSESLLQKLLAFRADRDWGKFHTPKNLAIALSVESAELLELFQWMTDSESVELISHRRTDIENEIADLAILLSYLCHDLQIDLDKAVRAKVALNAVKYPIEKSKGVAKKYDRL